MKREQERQRTEVSLSIPDDHPVRKLFQKFRQQRDAQAPGEPAAYADHNCVQVESHHRPRRPGTPRQPDTTAGGAAGPPPVCREDSEERRAADRPPEQPRADAQKVGRPADGERAAGRGGGGGGGCRGARGWARFRNASSAAPPPPTVEKQELQRDEEWPKGPPEQQGAPDKKQDPEEAESAEGVNRGGGGEEENGAMHKTDSCDSGITVRIERAGDSRSSFEKSPMEKSPVERNPFDHAAGVESLKQPSPPPPEQTLLQAMLHQAKLELKGDIQILSGRLAILESQVSEILRLLSIRRRLSLPPISSPRLRAKSQDLAAAPALPEAED